VHHVPAGAFTGQSPEIADQHGVARESAARENQVGTIGSIGSDVEGEDVLVDEIPVPADSTAHT